MSARGSFESNPVLGGYRLGISLVGRHVSGALLDATGSVVAVMEQEVTTTPPPGTVLRLVLDSVLSGSDGITVDQIDRVMLAVTEVDGLAGFPEAGTASWRLWPGTLGPVAVVRLGEATSAVPPLSRWPQDLRQRISVAEVCVTGGAMLDGSEFEPLDLAGLAEFGRSLTGRVTAVAITGVFASVNPKHELSAATVLREELGYSVPMLLSHEFGGLGLVERENSTVLQAVLTGPASRAAERTLDTLAQQGLAHAEVFVARNDGTIAALDYAVTHPLLLQGGADATAARGVAWLAGETDALVVLTNPDGTARAVCAVTAGSPRQTTGRTTIAGVPTGLRVIALVPVEPASGTDPDAAEVAEFRLLSDALDRAKDAPGDLPLLLAGPGAPQLAATLPSELPGISRISCPPGAEAAGAVGVAAAPCSGEAERIVPLNSLEADRVRAAVREAARSVAVRAGADPAQVAVTGVEESPVAYLADPAVVIRVRADGPPRLGMSPNHVFDVTEGQVTDVRS